MINYKITIVFSSLDTYVRTYVHSLKLDGGKRKERKKENGGCCTTWCSICSRYVIGEPYSRAERGMGEGWEGGEKVPTQLSRDPDKRIAAEDTPRVERSFCLPLQNSRSQLISVSILGEWDISRT